MKGLLNQPTSPPVQDEVPTPGTTSPVQGEAPQPPGGMDPQIQDKFDMYLANGIKIVHNKKISDGFIKQIMGAEDPIIAIANATLNIVDRLEQSASGRGVDLPMEYLAQVANILMGEIMESAETAGLKPLNDEQKYQAFSLAVSTYLDKAYKSGKISKEQLAQMGDRAKQTPEGQQISQMLEGGSPTQPPANAVQPAGASMAAAPGPAMPPGANMGRVM